jgi:membrane protein DedA with SNARE-associated domain
VQGFLDWLSGLPEVALYLVMFVAAAFENIFPPLPADTIVAFGSFLAARGSGTIVGAFFSTWLGNLSGAAAMYFAGRRYGADRMGKRLVGNEGGPPDSRLRTLHGRYGMSALFVSRFIPGIRAMVPPFAGAARLSFWRSMIVMGVASGIWYGLVSYLAFRLGADWNVLQQTIVDYGRIAMVVAIGLVIVGATVWLVRRRRAMIP